MFNRHAARLALICALAATLTAHARVYEADGLVWNVLVPELATAEETAAYDAEVLAYWTPERMSSATPADVATSPELEPSRFVSREEFAASESRYASILKQKGVTAGKIAAWTAPTIASSADENATASQPLDLLSSDRVRGRTLQQYPFHAIGKLFFRFGNEHNVCSAQIWSARGVATAAHCIHKGAGGGFGTGVMFAVQYDGGRYGRRFPLHRMVVPDGWSRAGSFKDDFAGAWSSSLLTKYGSVAWSVHDESIPDTWMAYGYPAAKPYNGEYLYVCSDRAAQSSGPGIVAKGNHLTGGSSGGMWGRLTTEGFISMNGVNSWHYKGDNSVMFSPFFGNVVITVRDWLDAQR